jgi:hypothetical protein
MKRMILSALVIAASVVALADIPIPGNYSTKFDEKSIEDSAAAVVADALNPANTQVVTESLRNQVTHKIWNSKNGQKQIHCQQTKAGTTENVLSSSCTIRASKDGKSLRPVKIPRRLG